MSVFPQFLPFLLIILLTELFTCWVDPEVFWKDEINPVGTCTGTGSLNPLTLSLCLSATTDSYNPSRLRYRYIVFSRHQCLLLPGVPRPPSRGSPRLFTGNLFLRPRFRSSGNFGSRLGYRLQYSDACIVTLLRCSLTRKLFLSF